MLGMLQYGIRALVLNTDLGWGEQVEIEVKFHRELKLQHAMRALREHLMVFERSGGVAIREAIRSIDWDAILYLGHWIKPR
jgi:hypothetical protein